VQDPGIYQVIAAWDRVCTALAVWNR
jgi:hypothetical protein